MLRFMFQACCWLPALRERLTSHATTRQPMCSKNGRVMCSWSVFKWPEKIFIVSRPRSKSRAQVLGSRVTLFRYEFHIHNGCITYYIKLDSNTYFGLCGAPGKSLLTLLPGLGEDQRIFCVFSASGALGAWRLKLCGPTALVVPVLGSIVW